MRTLSFSIESTVKHLLEEKKYSSLKDVLSTMNPPDLADVLEKISEEQMPLVFRLLPKKIGFDPAVMASPFITTIIDAISLMIYFTIARGFLFR